MASPLSAALCLLLAIVCVDGFLPRPSSKRLPVVSALFGDLVSSLCSEVAAGNPLAGDACYGCFSQYSRMTQAENAREQLQRCSNTYLNATSYHGCQLLFGNFKINTDGTSKSFCEFEKCVRKGYMESILENCAKESGEAKSEADKYRKITACVVKELERRDALVDSRQVWSLQQPRVYALYMADDGELRAQATYPGANDQYTCEAINNNEPQSAPGNF